MDLIKTKKTADQRYSEQLEANALASLHQAASAEIINHLGLELIEYCGTMISIASKLPDAKALNCCLTAHHVDTHLSFQEVRLLYQSRGVRRYQLHQNMFTEPPSEQELRMHKLVARGASQMLELIISDAEISAQKIVIVKISHNQAWDFGVMASYCLGLDAQAVSLFSQLPIHPDWHVFMSYENYLPCGVAALFIQGTNAWLDLVAIPEQKERQQTALISRCVQYAAEVGCTKVYTKCCLQSALPQNSVSSGVLLNLGFRKTYIRQTYTNDSSHTVPHLCPS
ncbi:hypothetical protein [Lacimicrobium alkaliphilum]|uniref:N-acetyltransferase domain-containing protein n=1 Tax=Lacimicrobium alkaliphilum TaxID=1526571 RepID=A0A0U2RJJ8_9ALTE|nr:hypothetical protein [Lacimicrobium alkaliphilum]ALS97418.1 hypothetical protein AT746_03435 [Lacimicrobium alkaliphilum]